MRLVLFLSIALNLLALPASGSYCYKSQLIHEKGDENEHAQSPIVACSHGQPIYRGSAVSPRESDDYDQEYYVRSDGQIVKYLATPDVLMGESDRMWVASGESLFHQQEKKVSKGRSLASISRPRDAPRIASKDAHAVYKKVYESFARSKQLGKLKVERLNGSSWTQKITTSDGLVLFKNDRGVIATLNKFNEWIYINPKGEIQPSAK